MFKIFLLVSAQALLIQTISAQCFGAYPALGAPCCLAPSAAAPCGTGWRYSAASLAASNGPGLAISSSSPISPVGVSVTSENAIEGALAVAGAIPFLGTVGLEGVLPTAGAGAVTYNCGNGEVAILAEDLALAPIVGTPLAAGGLGYGSYGYAPGPFNYGGPYGPAVGCGCGGFI